MSSLSGKHSPEAPREVVEAAKAIAGDGDLDERCRRLVGALGWRWGFPVCDVCGGNLSADRDVWDDHRCAG